jgi:hypothetical protein
MYLVSSICLFVHSHCLLIHVCQAPLALDRELFSLIITILNIIHITFPQIVSCHHYITPTSIHIIHNIFLFEKALPLIKPFCTKGCFPLGSDSIY